MELEAEPCDASSESETSKDFSARITFTTRRTAEKAFVNGKCWQGHNLKFMWLASSTPSNDRSVKEGSPSTPKGSLNADGESGEKLTCIGSQEPASSGTCEAENQETRSGVEHMELSENSQPSSSPTSSKKVTQR